MVSWSDLAINKDIGGFNKDKSCTIAKSLHGKEASHEHEDNAFLYVEMMWRESCRS